MGILGGGALEGSLGQFSLPDILALLSLTKKTGGLHLTTPQREGVVYFESGAVTGANADISRQSLGRRLVGHGLVTDEAILEAATSLPADHSVGLGRILRDTDIVPAETMSEIAGEQAADAVFDLLRWDEGDFTFRTDEPNPEDLGVSLVTQDVVSEAQTRLEKWAELTRSVPAPDAVPSVNVRTGTDEVSVSTDEWSLMVLIDGQRTVRQLGECTGFGDYETMVRLVALVERGLVSLRRAGSADANDSVAALLRRQEMLTQLEAGTLPSAPARASRPAPAQPLARAAFQQQPPPRRPGVGLGAKAARPGVGLGAKTAPSTPAGIDPKVDHATLLRIIDGLRKA